MPCVEYEPILFVHSCPLIGASDPDPTLYLTLSLAMALSTTLMLSRAYMWLRAVISPLLTAPC